MTIKVKSEDWKRIRNQFTEGEKDELQRAHIGETICPPAGILDEEQLSPSLRNKLTTAIGELPVSASSTPKR